MSYKSNRIIEYPTLKQPKQITFEEKDRQHIILTIKQIESIVQSRHCPPHINNL
jgi:CRISPR/Cas system-associated exonuclease Cas4 (RecB family)